MSSKVSGSNSSNSAQQIAKIKAEEQQALAQLDAQQKQIDSVISKVEDAAPVVKSVVEGFKNIVDHQFSVERSAVEAKYAAQLKAAAPAPSKTPAKTPSKTPAKPTPKKPSSTGGSKTTGTNTVATKPLPKSIQPFINEVAPGAVAAQKKYGVPASVTIAQAILESGWGKSGLAASDNNLFGIKGTGPAGSVTVPTKEFENGHYVTINAAFRKYHNDAESIDDHAKLLATSGYYKKAMGDKGNANKFADDLTGVYATDPHYGTQLQQIMKQYNLYQYDDPKLAGSTGTSSGSGTKPTPTPTKPTSSGGTKKPTAKPSSYVVKSGDSLSGIASKAGVSLSALEKANPQIKNFNLIYPGEKINLPGGSKAPSSGGTTKSGGPTKSGGTSAPAAGSKNPATIAQSFLGDSEYQLQPSGKLDMDGWVPKTEDCANFVSGCLEKAGILTHSQRSDNVRGVFSSLEAKGWKGTPLADAKPGDVVAFDGPSGPYQHIEIFSHWDGKTPVFIGSNNVMSDGTQKISYDVGGTWAHAFHVLAPPA